MRPRACGPWKQAAWRIYANHFQHNDCLMRSTTRQVSSEQYLHPSIGSFVATLHLRTIVLGRVGLDYYSRRASETCNPPSSALVRKEATGTPSEMGGTGHET